MHREGVRPSAANTDECHESGRRQRATMTLPGGEGGGWATRAPGVGRFRTCTAGSPDGGLCAGGPLYEPKRGGGRPVLGGRY
jgi:hypothetical protein